MARIHPAGWDRMPVSPGIERERQTLEQLAKALDDTYTVYHGVHWTRVDARQRTRYGEIDFAIVSAAGQVLLIEQKAGLLMETADGLLKRYADGDKPVPLRLAVSTDALRTRLLQVCRGDTVVVHSILYCPDYTIRSPGTAGIPPERIVDASRREQLAAIVRALLPADAPAMRSTALVHAVLSEAMRLVPDTSALVGEAAALYTRLSGGLAWWARRIECHPHRLRVVGTAGSGKTQLALAVMREAAAAARRTLYVCYNRPLADHIARLAPPGCDALTYHQLGERLLRARGQRPDFGQPGVFATLEAALDTLAPGESPPYDELLVDEGQDMHPQWAHNLLRHLRPEGRAWWLEDPMQNLYGRAPVELPGWVVLRSEVNYRTPRRVIDALNRLLPPEGAVEAGSPIEGYEVELLEYRDARSLIDSTVTAISRALGAGFTRAQIAVVSYRGRDRSMLAPYDRIGPYRLRAPTGRYDLLGQQEFTDGDVLIDSVHRFKGQAAGCVILTEIDFAQLDARASSRLFVGATRATMKLVLVAAEDAARQLRERLEADPGLAS
jgi:hypothetical protein